MTSLIRGLRELRFFQPKEHRIVVLGNDASGKTTLLYRLKLGEAITAIPTIGFNVETVDYKRKSYTLWDVGGCDKIRPLWRHYVSNYTELLYIHSLVDDRLDESLEGLRMASEMMVKVQAKHIWIVFNKQDLLPATKRDETLANHRKLFEKELQAITAKIDCTIVDLPGFSAMTGDQCFELMRVIHETLENSTKRKPVSNDDPSPSALPANSEIPTEASLIAHIEQEQLHDLDAEEFWEAFLSADIEVWNHRCHLRAGYVLLLDALRSGHGIFKCVETFLEHLQRLKEAKPDRFRNTEHRTMTVFWLHHLQLAILNYKTDKDLDKWPVPGLFHEVLSHSPYLMHTGLWKDYYTKDLMMSSEAKQYWRLPDLQTLPNFAEKTQAQKRQVRRLSQEEPYRLMRFAFAVVQKYLSSSIRRGWLVQRSLAALQTTTIRLRAQNPTFPPYSETKAYFWIQVVHAALASVATGTNKMPLIKVPLDRLSFSSFRVLFDMDPSLWRDYYTPKMWDSIEARMNFVNPDLKPLPNVINVSSADNAILALDKQMDSARIGMAAELPSMEELALRSALLLDEIATIPETERSGPNIATHAHLLYYLFGSLVTKPKVDTVPVATRATSAMMEITGSYVKSLTLKAFWTQQVLGVSSKSEATVKFDDFIRANLHLTYTDLPLCYYSPELLHSLEANETIVQPDRRKLKGFLPVAGSQVEDDWVVV